MFLKASLKITVVSLKSEHLRPLPYNVFELHTITNNKRQTEKLRFLDLNNWLDYRGFLIIKVRIREKLLCLYTRYINDGRE